MFKHSGVCSQKNAHCCSPWPPKFASRGLFKLELSAAALHPPPPTRPAVRMEKMREEPERRDHCRGIASPCRENRGLRVSGSWGNCSTWAQIKMWHAFVKVTKEPWQGINYGVSPFLWRNESTSLLFLLKLKKHWRVAADMKEFRLVTVCSQGSFLRAERKNAFSAIFDSDLTKGAHQKIQKNTLFICFYTWIQLCRHPVEQNLSSHYFMTLFTDLGWNWIRSDDLWRLLMRR